jgi:hypothetical protein
MPWAATRIQVKRPKVEGRSCFGQRESARFGAPLPEEAAHSGDRLCGHLIRAERSRDPMRRVIVILGPRGNVLRKVTRRCPGQIHQFGSSLLGDVNWETCPAAGIDSASQSGVLLIDRPFRDAWQDRLDGDPSFEPGQVGPQTEVGAETEGENLTGFAVNVEAVRFLPLALIAIGCRRDHDKDTVRGNGLVVELNVFRHPAAEVVCRGLAPKDFLDRIRDE